MVGEKLRKMRKEKKLTQGELGAMVGVAANTIARYEHDRMVPSSDVLFKLSQALEVPMSSLLDVDLSVEEDESTIVAARISVKILDNPTLQKIAELLCDMNAEQLKKVASVLTILFNDPQDQD